MTDVTEIDRKMTELKLVEAAKQEAVRTAGAQPKKDPFEFAIICGCVTLGVIMFFGFVLMLVTRGSMFIAIDSGPTGRAAVISFWLICIGSYFYQKRRSHRWNEAFSRALSDRGLSIYTDPN